MIINNSFEKKKTKIVNLTHQNFYLLIFLLIEQFKLFSYSFYLFYQGYFLFLDLMFESKKKNDIDDENIIFKCLTDLFFYTFCWCILFIYNWCFVIFFIRLYNLRSDKIIKRKVSLIERNLYYRDLVFHIDFM